MQVKYCHLNVCRPRTKRLLRLNICAPFLTKQILLRPHKTHLRQNKCGCLGTIPKWGSLVQAKRGQSFEASGVKVLSIAKGSWVQKESLLYNWSVCWLLPLTACTHAWAQVLITYETSCHAQKLRKRIPKDQCAWLNRAPSSSCRTITLTEHLTRYAMLIHHCLFDHISKALIMLLPCARTSWQ